MYQVEELHHALAGAGRDSRFCLVSTPHGHDAFLIELDALNRELGEFLE